MRYLMLFIAIALSSGARAEEGGSEALLTEAQQDYVNGEFAAARDKARKCIKVNLVRAYRIIGAASCWLKDRGAAIDAYNHVDNSNRQFIRYVCYRNQVDLP